MSASGCSSPASSGLGTQRAPPPSMASGSRPGSSRQPRLLPPPGLEAPEPRRDRHPRPFRLVGLSGSPTGRRGGPAASGGARPRGLLASPARHAPFPAPLAWGPGLRPRPGLRPGSQSSLDVLGHPDLWPASRALLRIELGALIPAIGFHALWGATHVP